MGRKRGDGEAKTDRVPLEEYDGGEGEDGSRAEFAYVP